MGPLAEAAIGKAGIVRQPGGALNAPLVQGGAGGGGGGGSHGKVGGEREAETARGFGSG